ncbi:MAG: hypothetical protein ACI835_002962 [Planctomycetota bacterium]|jgi:hypothetical protein
MLASQSAKVLGLNAVILTTLGLGSSLYAQGVCQEEPAVDNHTGPGTITCPCFVTGEEAGAVFNVPAAHYPIEILRVGIGWGSQLGGAPNQLEEAIHIYAGGLPNPGVPIFSIGGPQLTDGFINEFDLEILPGDIIVNSGQFSVTLEFFNDSNIFAPSVVHDGAGCSPGRNLVKAIPGGWNDACALGVSGNWLFHVVYRQTNCGGTNQTYCVTSANSVGLGSEIGFQGTTSIVANDLILTATANPVSQFGVFYYGENQIQAPFGDGFRCVGAGAAGTSRFNPAVAADLFGNAFIAVDYSAPPAGGGPGAILSGSTWNFQFWYRDPAFGGAGFNLSNGLSLSFVP